MMKIILQEYKKVMTILTVLWITKLIRRIYFTLDYKADCEDS
jgi:hypothetical protein